MPREDLRCHHCEEYTALAKFRNLGRCPHQRGLVLALGPVCRHFKARALDPDPPSETRDYSDIPPPTLNASELCGEAPEREDPDRHYPETLARLDTDSCGDCQRWRSVGKYANTGRCPYVSGPVHRLAPVKGCPHFKAYERPPNLFGDVKELVGNGVKEAK